MPPKRRAKDAADVALVSQVGWLPRGWAPLGAPLRRHIKIDLLHATGTITTSSYRAQTRLAPGQLFFRPTVGIRFAYGVAAAGPGPKALAATRMYVRKVAKSALVLAPAKVNLSLEVLCKRADGFHEIETIIAPLGVFDSLEFTPADHGEIRLACRWSAGLAGHASGDLPAGQKNIVWRAVSLLRERAGVAAGADICLVKRIPSAAGLGGASSDAAAALVAANLAWQLQWSVEQLTGLAAEIGSDVAFFMQNGASICRGRGERIESLSACRLQVVVVRPPEGLSTPSVYQACRPAIAPMSSKPLEQALTHGKVAAAAQLLNNRLEEASASLSPWIVRLRTEFSRQGLLGHQMTGSGSSYFGVCWHARQARRVAVRLRARRLGWARSATTLAAKD